MTDDDNLGMGLVPPDITSAEKAVLGAIIHDSTRVLDALSEEIPLTGNDFGNPRYGDVFDMLRARHMAGEPIDPPSLEQPFRDARIDPTLIYALYEHGYFAAGFREHAEIVARNGAVRRIRAAMDGMEQINASSSVEQMRAHAYRLLDDAFNARLLPVQYVDDLVNGVTASSDTGPDCVLTPWSQMNDLIGGLRPGAMYVVAARPGVGKSVIGLQLATAMTAAGAVAFSSLEMSQEEVTRRLLAERLEIPMARVMNNRLNDSDREKIDRLRHRVRIPIAIDATAGVTPLDVRAFARRVAKQQPLAGVVVDYLQLMSSMDPKQRRYEAVTDFSRHMKLLAKDMHVPVVALSQLNRESERRGFSEPRISDLRDSGAIEQDADVIILLSRDTSDEGNTLGTIRIDVAKNRHGQTGFFDLAWHGHFARAVEMGGL